MAEHGTRTMYVHYGCRCDACCRAEHEQYLKRKEAKMRKRTASKWGEHYAGFSSGRKASQKRHNARRWEEFKNNPSTHTHPIVWQEIAEKYRMRCAICGELVDPEDKWMKNGRMCYGRKYPTVDHIVPLRLGGADVLENVQLACKQCNSAKGVRNNESFIESKQKRAET